MFIPTLNRPNINPAKTSFPLFRSPNSALNEPVVSPSQGPAVHLREDGFLSKYAFPTEASMACLDSARYVYSEALCLGRPL